jgi:transcriptional regulator with PAS, ATPase and Fis domain
MPDQTERTDTDIEATQGGDAARTTTTAAWFLCLSCHQPALGGARYLLADVAEISIGRSDELSCRRSERRLEIGLPDRRVSALHARIVRSAGAWVITDAGSKNGISVDGAQAKRAVLTDNCQIEIGHSLFLFRSALALRSTAEARQLEQDDAPWPSPGTATLIPALQEQFLRARKFALTELPIALLGDTGTGKELLARAIHDASGRTGPFVGLNCGALPESLIESELFGSRRGAFSGATEERQGLVRAADKGTLFLDEIGDLPLALQVRFLRLLQEHEVTPLGGTQPISVDLRVISATHRDLETMVERGELRSDLFARLSGTTIRLPRLRDRREDLGLLVASMLRKLTRDPQSIRLSLAAGRALLAYQFPHNMRELERALSAAVTVARGGVIELLDLPEAVRGRQRTSPSSAASQLSGEELKLRERLVTLLEQHRGNLSAVARQMGKGRTQIQRWVKRYGLAT